jgi:DNA polymerase-1
VQDFIERTKEQATRDGYVTSLLGRRRPVQEIRASSRQTRSARRAPRGQLRDAGLERGHHQGRDAAHPRAAAQRGPRARLVLQVHDELLLEVPDAEVSACATLVREEMCGAYPLDPPLAVDIGVGDNWAEAKVLTRPVPA